MISESQIIAKEGYGLLLIFLIVALVLSFLHPVAGAAGFGAFCFCLYFFRNPKRIPPDNGNLVVAPADGKVVFSGKSQEKFFLQRKMQKISIFMSPLDVHVNRSPAAGVVKNKKYHKGCFHAAFSDRSSDTNEQMAIHLQTEDGEDIVFVQVAGWLARRIVCYPEVNHKLKRGEIFGMIKFGSRMDVYLPEGYTILVRLHQKLKAGQSILAKRNGA